MNPFCNSANAENYAFQMQAKPDQTFDIFLWKHKDLRYPTKHLTFFGKTQRFEKTQKSPDILLPWFFLPCALTLFKIYLKYLLYLFYFIIILPSQVKCSVG